MIDLSKKEGVFRLRDLVEIPDQSISKTVIEENDKFRMIMVAFDADKLLAEHRAPGNGVLTVVQGRVAISYKGNTYDLKEGESFFFPKGELHSVYAPEQAKVVLVLDLA